MCFVTSSPPVLQEHNFIQSDGGQLSWWLPGLLCTLPLLPRVPSVFSLSSLPHRNPTLPLLLWASPQPEGVSETRGMMTMEGGDGMLSPDQRLPCSPSGILVPWWIGARNLTPPALALVLSLQVFDPSRFAPGSDRHSHAFLPFSGGSR